MNPSGRTYEYLPPTEPNKLPSSVSEEDELLFRETHHPADYIEGPADDLAIRLKTPRDSVTKPAEGSAIYNLMRQLGGSAGIAYLSTFINHRIDGHYQLLAESVNLYNPAAVSRLQGLSQFFMSKGYDASQAGQQALSVLQKTVLQQSAILSYQDAFVLMGFVFLVTMPLLLLFERKSHLAGKGGPAAHLE